MMSVAPLGLVLLREARYLGLTPQAMYLSRLRRSISRCRAVVARFEAGDTAWVAIPKFEIRNLSWKWYLLLTFAGGST